MVKYREDQIFRILYCSTALSFGGEQKQLVQILSNLDREHFQPIVCCIRQFGYVEQEIRNLTTKFLCLRVQSRYNLLGAIRGLRQVIKDHGIDLIHLGIFGSEFAGLGQDLSGNFGTAADEQTIIFADDGGQLLRRYSNLYVALETIVLFQQSQTLWGELVGHQNPIHDHNSGV